MSMLDFSSLAKAVDSLAAALQAAKTRPRDEFIRDAKALHTKLLKVAQ